MTDEAKVAEEELPEEEGFSLADLSFAEIEALLPERSSVSIGHLSAGKWTVILRPLPAEPPKLLMPGYVPPSNTPIMATGSSLGATMEAVLGLLAPADMRCPACREFCVQKLASVAGSTSVLECLTCGKKYTSFKT